MVPVLLGGEFQSSVLRLHLHTTPCRTILKHTTANFQCTIQSMASVMCFNMVCKVGFEPTPLPLIFVCRLLRGFEPLAGMPPECLPFHHLHHIETHYSRNRTHIERINIRPGIPLASYNVLQYGMVWAKLRVVDTAPSRSFYYFISTTIIDTLVIDKALIPYSSTLNTVKDAGTSQLSPLPGDRTLAAPRQLLSVECVWIWDPL